MVFILRAHNFNNQFIEIYYENASILSEKISDKNYILFKTVRNERTASPHLSVTFFLQFSSYSLRNN